MKIRFGKKVWRPFQTLKALIIVAAVAAVIIGMLLLFVRAYSINDCQHNRNTLEQSFEQCMEQRYPE